VSCPRNNMPFVAIKMGRRQGARRAHPAPLSILLVLLDSPGQHKSGAGRNRRATQPPAHFHRNPLGRGRLAVFPRCSLLTYRLRYARRSRLEKQPTDLRRKTRYFGDRTLASQSFRVSNSALATDAPHSYNAACVLVFPRN